MSEYPPYTSPDVSTKRVQEFYDARRHIFDPPPSSGAPSGPKKLEKCPDCVPISGFALNASRALWICYQIQDDFDQGPSVDADTSDR